MAGDITQPNRPRYQSNERFDTVDANAASLAPRDHDDAITRALLSTPRNVVATPTGLIVTGFSLTPNPTAANDGLVRINAETGVALDANGRTIIKPFGTTLDISIPIGTHQIYVYYVEVPTDVAKRRFLPAAPPFVEFTQAIDTAFQGEVGTFLRVGGLASAVASDVVNGATTPLCLIGIATNAGAGVITIIGYNAVTAPNGTDIVNRLTAVLAPPIPPTTNTRNGSPQTIHDVLTAALYMAGQSAWLGSDFLTPLSANNFGAYNVPAGGVDKAFRQAIGYVTIGNGTTVKGDFNTSDYGNANLLLTAALASLPAAGGTIFFKRGTSLAGFAGATIALPAGKTVEFLGEHNTIPATAPQLTFTATEGLVCSATGKLVLRNLHVQHASTAITLTTSPCEVYDVYAENIATTAAGAFLQGTDVSDLTIERLTATTVLTVTGAANAMVLRITGIGRRIRTNLVRHIPGSPTFEDCPSIAVLDMREDVTIENTTYQTIGAGPGGGTAAIVQIDTTVNTTVTQNRVIRNLNVGNALNTCIDIGDVGYLVIDELHQAFDTSSTQYGITATSYIGVGSVLVRNSFFGSQFNINLSGAFPDLTFRNCRFEGFTGTIGSTTSDLGRITFDDCTFAIGVVLITGQNVAHALITRCRFLNGGQYLFGIPFYGVSVRAANPFQLDRAEFIDNIIDGWSNFAYGANTTTPFGSVFQAHGQSCNTVVCTGNRMHHVADTASGSALRKGVYLLLVAGNTLVVDANGFNNMTILNNLVVHGNTVGQIPPLLSGVQDAAMLARIVVGVGVNYRFTDNNLNVTWSTTVGDTILGDLIFINGQCDIDFAVDSNHFMIWQASGTKISTNVLKAPTMSGMASFSFSYNTIWTNAVAGTFGWDHLTGWGLHVTNGSTIRNLSIFGNQAASASFFPGFETRFTGPPTVTFFIDGGVMPGAGVAWAFNNGVYGG